MPASTETETQQVDEQVDELPAPQAEELPDQLPTVAEMMNEIEGHLDDTLGVLRYPTIEDVLAAVAERIEAEQNVVLPQQRTGEHDATRRSTDGTAHEQK